MGAIFRGDIQDIEEDDDEEEDSPAAVDQVCVEVQERSDSNEDLLMNPESHPYFTGFEELIKLENEECGGKAWKVLNNSKDLKVFCRRTKDSPVLMVKAYCILEFPVKTVFTCISDRIIRKGWDKVFDEFKTVEEGDDFEVLYYSIKTPFGITKRDFLQRRTHIFDYPEKDSVTMHFKSIDHPLMP